MVGVGQVGVAVSLAGKRNEEAVSKPFCLALDAHIRTSLEILDQVDLARQGPERVLDFSNVLIRRSVFELKQDDVTQY